MLIEPGENTNQPVRERGWTYWHHLFPPRHLLMGALIRKEMLSFEEPALDRAQRSAFAERSTTCQDDPVAFGFRRTEALTGGSVDFPNHVFYNQALNTFLIMEAELSLAFAMRLNPNFAFVRTRQCEAAVEPIAADEDSIACDLAVTDPPYADAINYHEITEYFIAWLRRKPADAGVDLGQPAGARHQGQGRGLPQGHGRGLPRHGRAHAGQWPADRDVHPSGRRRLGGHGARSSGVPACR